MIRRKAFWTARASAWSSFWASGINNPWHQILESPRPAAPHVGGRFTTQGLELTVIGSVYRHIQRKRLTGKQINKQRSQKRPEEVAIEGKEISDKDLLWREGRGIQGPRTATDLQGPVLLIQASSFPSGRPPHALTSSAPDDPRG